MIEATVKHSDEQYNAAMGFLDMAQRPIDYSIHDRKNFILMAFMHAQSAAVIGEAAGIMGFDRYDLKSHIKDGCEVLIHGGSLDKALEAINKTYSPYETPVFDRVNKWLGIAE